MLDIYGNRSIYLYLNQLITLKLMKRDSQVMKWNDFRYMDMIPAINQHNNLSYVSCPLTRSIVKNVASHWKILLVCSSHIRGGVWTITFLNDMSFPPTTCIRALDICDLGVF